MSEIFRRLPALGAMLISSALLICFSAGRTQAATSGPNNPSSASGTNWVNSTGIFAVDSSSASYNNTTQDYLFVTGFGFSVSTHAVVQGISVSRKGSSLGTTAARRQYQMALTKNGTALVGTAKTGLALPQTTDDTVVVGSTSDVWGTTWTGAEVSSPSFGVMLRDNDTTAFQISFDNVNVTITYTPPEPQSVSISSTSTTSIQATWTNATTPEQGFTFEASTDVFPNSYTGNKSSTTVSTANTSLTISALQANTTYFTRVGSRWTDGTTTYASAVTTATLAVPVTTTQIYQAFLNSVTVNWQALPASPSTSTCEGYRLQASTASDFSGTLISSQTSSVALSTLTVTGLAAGTTYYFRVGSLNWYGGANYINAGSTMTLSGWSLSKVDYPTNLSNATAMALDSLGRPEIVYYEVSNFKMKFAQWTGTSWSTQTVNANNDAGSFSSIVIDPSDYPHTSFQYHDPSFLNLNYAEYNGSIWSTTTIDSAGDVGWYTSIARDGAGNLHISYYSNTAHDLKYAKWNGTRWSTQTIDSAGDVGAYSSLVVDSTGNPYISYQDTTNFKLKLAKWNGTSWSTQTVNNGGANSSIAVSPNGVIHISYDDENGALAYARYDGVSWSTQTVDAASTQLDNTSIALDGAGNPHIAYYDALAANLNLKYAYYNGVWNIVTLDSAGDVGQSPSIAIDASGIVKISYLDNTNQDVKLASTTYALATPALGGGNAKGRVGAPTNFAASNVYYSSVTWTWTDNASSELGYRLYGSTTSTGTYTLIAGTTSLAANTVSYTETGLSNGTTYYRYLVAVNAGGYVFSNFVSTKTLNNWKIAVVDPGGDVGEDNSIALDSNGNPHIAYYDYGTGGSKLDLKYAKWTGTAWSTQTVDSVGDVGPSPSIALDSNDYPHISYYDTTNDSVKYAKWTGTAWSTQTVDTGTGLLTSIAVDPWDRPHIVSADPTSAPLKYARWTGTSWSTATIGTHMQGGSIALVLDAQSRPNVIYRDTGVNVNYTMWTGVAWTSSTVNNVDFNTNLSLALDPNGIPNVVYVLSAITRHARLVGGSWTETQLTGAGDTTSPALALDGNGNAQVSYSVAASSTVGFASWNGNAWSYQTVNPSGGGGMTSLALDAAGRSHVSYYDVTGNPSLEYASATIAGVAATFGGGNAKSRTQAPNGFSATTVYSTSVTWSWTDNASNELGYRLYGSTVSTGTYTLIVGSTTLGANSNTYTEQGLTTGTTYYRYVVVVSTGNYAFSNATAACAGVINYLAVPAVVQVTAASTGTLTATWGLVTNATGYTLVASTMSTNPPTPIAGSTTTVGNAITTGTVSGLLPNTTYYLFVRSNGAGVSAYSAFNATSTWANLPSNIQLGGVFYTSMTVTWTALPTSPSSSTCAGYLVQASTMSDFSNVVYSSQTSLSQVASLTVSTLTMNATYYYRVGSLNQAGIINFSTSGSTRTLSPWSVALVDPGFSTDVSLALDATGNPAITYNDENGFLTFAQWTGSAWSIQTIESGPADYYTSLIFNASGNPAVSYYDSTNHDLKFAQWSGSAWSTQTVDSNGDVGWYTSLAVAGDGYPAISYYDNSNGDLKYAKWTGSAWSTQTVEAANNVGNYSSLAFDATGNPGISYYDGTNGDLKYAKWNGLSWSTETVDASGQVGQYTALSFNASGNPFIAYHDVTNLDLKVAQWTGTSWSTQTVDFNGAVGTNNALVLDGNGKPMIAYTDVSGSMPRFAQWTGSSWSIVNISTIGLGGLALSLAIDANGVAKVAYGDSVGDVGIKFASATLSGVTAAIGGGNAKSRPQAPTNFAAANVYTTSVTWSWTDNASNELGYRLYGSTVSTGTYTLIVDSTTLGANSNSYTEPGLTSGTTYYRYVVAVNAGNYAFSNAFSTCTTISNSITWSTATIVSTPNANWYTSIALDLNGYPAISYYDSTNQDFDYAKWNGTAWSTQTIESSGNVGRFSSLAFDASNYPAISYYDDTHGYLKYAKWNGASWSTQTVDSSGNVGGPTSVALDPQGNPAISYCDSATGYLRYAKWNGSIWSTQTVDSPGFVGAYISMALDVVGNPAISYYDSNNQDLKYAKWNGTSWSTQTIDSTGNVGNYSSLSLNSNGYPSISYKDATNADVKYAKWDGASWSTETVDSVGDVGSDNSMALDGNGYPNITYWGNSYLKYAQWNGASWTVQAVDPLVTGGFTSIAIDGSGVSHISYIDGTNVALRYASATLSGVTPAIGGGNAKSRPQAPTNFAATTISTGSITWTWTDNASNELGYRLYGSLVSTGPYTLIVGSTTLGANSNSYTETGLSPNTTYYRYIVAVNAGGYAFSNFVSTKTLSEWSLSTVDAPTHIANDNALTLDSSGRPRIVYYESTNFKMKYASWTGTAWSTSTVNTTIDAGQYCSIAMDASDNVHVSAYHHDPSFLNLYYAKFNGVTWSTSTLDTAGNTGLFTSIAVDGAGNIHISYYDGTAKDLRYAKWNGTSWSTSTIESTGDTGWYTSIAVDPAGNPHISYLNNTTQKLKYAKWTGSAWSTQTVTGGNAAGNTSIAVDGNGNVHISYDDDLTQLAYAKWNGTSWSTQTVDNLPANMDDTAIALDGSGYPHIAYYDATTANKNLKYARWTGTAWSTKTVDTTGDVGLSPSIAIDGSGVVHITYLDNTNFDLEYASSTAAMGVGALGGGNAKGRVGAPTNLAAANVYVTSVTWTWTDNASNELGFRLYGSTSSGGPFSLMADSATLAANANSFTETGLSPNTTYYRYVVAVNAGGYAFSNFISTKTLPNWSIQTVDPGIADYTAMTLDSAGNMLVSYHENSLLKYAKWNGTSWSTQTVDSLSGGDVGSYTSIAVDNAGNPAISYYDTTNGDLKYAKWSGSAWSTQTVDTTGNVGKYSSLALDGAGNPRIGYYDTTNGDLKYAQWNGTSWSTETVDNGGGATDVGRYCALALDGAGNPRISYRDQTNADLKYAQWTGTSWSTESIDTALDSGGYTSLALDGSGNAHIAYFDFSANKYRHVYWTGAAWSSQIVDSVNGASITPRSSLALDGAGNPMMSYAGYTSDADLNFAQWTGSAWSTQTVDAVNSAGETSSLAIGGSAGRAHIIYTDGTTFDLKYASATIPGITPAIGAGRSNGMPQAPTSFSASAVYRTSATWTWTDNASNELGYRLYGSTVSTGTYTLIAGTTTLGSNSNSYAETGLTPDTTYYRYVVAVNAGGYAFSNAVSTRTLSSGPWPWSLTTIDPAGGTTNSLALDASGNPGITYPTVGLQYAKWNGSSWSTQTADSQANVGAYPSLAFNVSGNPGISYQDTNTFYLKYAKWTGSSWSTQTVDSGPDVGYYTSLAFDPSGNPGITYYDNTNKDLKYAKWTGSAWSTQTVDSNGDVGSFGSLAFDPGGNPAISYLDSSNLVLKYAKWTGSAWSTQTVDSSLTVGYHSSLALDANGNPAISYWDGNNGDLKYAKWDGSAWSTQTVDAGGDVGRYSSLALDGNGYPTISYRDTTNTLVKFAQWTGSAWSIQNISTASLGGFYTSLALGSNGVAHVSYCDTTGNIGIKYASATIAGMTGAVSGGNGRSRPQVPTSFAASNVYTTSVTWSWTDNASNELGYRLYGSTVSTGTYSLIADSTTLGANSNTYTETNLSPNTTYYRYAVAVNAGGYAFSNFISTKTLPNWSVTTIDATGDVGRNSSMVLDSAGNPRVVYFVAVSSDLKYAEWNGSSWNVQTIESSPDVGQYPSIALDSSDKAHVSYYDIGNQDLKYAKWTGSAWSTSTVESAGNVGQYTSIAVDGAGNPHISYTLGGAVKYASWTGSSWSTETVSSAGGTIQFTSLALDAAGRPQISFYDSFGNYLRHAAWNGSSWTVQTVDGPTSITGFNNALVLDGSGYGAISYCNVTGGFANQLKYAKWNGSSWSAQVIVPANSAFSQTGITLDGLGQPQIAYYDGLNADLAYAQWNGTAWSTHTVDSGGTVGQDVSIAVDGSSRSFISYYDATNGDLKFASASLSGVVAALGGGNAKGRVGAPTNFAAASVYQTSVTWSWTDNASNELGYRLYGSTVSTGTYSLIADSTTLGANSNSYTETGLTSGTTYYRYVVAVNGGNYGFSNSTSTVTLSLGYSVPVGGPSSWIWKIPQAGDVVPSGTPNNWTWRTWTPGSGRKIPTGNANGWSWSSE